MSQLSLTEPTAQLQQIQSLNHLALNKSKYMYIHCYEPHTHTVAAKQNSENHFHTNHQDSNAEAVSKLKKSTSVFKGASSSHTLWNCLYGCYKPRHPCSPTNNTWGQSCDHMTPPSSGARDMRDLSRTTQGRGCVLHSVADECHLQGLGDWLRPRWLEKRHYIALLYGKRSQDRLSELQRHHPAICPREGVCPCTTL